MDSFCYIFRKLFTCIPYARDVLQLQRVFSSSVSLVWSRMPQKFPWSEVKSLSRVRLFATPWTVAYQAPLSMGFSRQQYWSDCHEPSLISSVSSKVHGLCSAFSPVTFCCCFRECPFLHSLVDDEHILAISPCCCMSHFQRDHLCDAWRSPSCFRVLGGYFF